jgi:hypothetical protein
MNNRRYTTKEEDDKSNYSLGLEVVRANDYTKNISSTLFSPGLIAKDFD